MIQTNDLTKRYGAKTALDHLSLFIPEGELFALLGVNGAGKTTAIKLLSCLCRPTEGDALLEGHSIVSDPLSVRSIIGVSPQESAVAPNLSVQENLELMAGVYGHHKKEAKEMAVEMLHTFFMDEIALQRACTLSGGWQRRLSIAMALIAEPKVLFLDEPTLGLDVLARRELWNHIRALKGRITIILTTHYLEEVEALADRVGILSAGKMKALGTVHQLCELTGTKNLEEAFVALCAEGGVV